MQEKPILTIGIPTYNRAQFLKRTVESITNSEAFETNKVEIVISDNCSTDNTKEVCEGLINKYGNGIIYVRQETPLFPDVNMFKPIEYANGIYCKFNNDTCAWKNGMLDKAIRLLENNSDCECFLFVCKHFLHMDKELTECHTLGDVVDVISVVITWIGCFCIKKETYEKIDNPLRYVETRFPISDIVGRLCAENKKILIYDSDQFDILLPYKKGASYNVAEAFGRNYFDVLSLYLDKYNGISKEIFESEKKKVDNHVNTYYFDYREIFNFQRTGYMKYMWKYYKFNPYFYINLLKCFLMYNIFCFDKQKGSKHLCLRIFGKLFVIKRNSYRLWQKKNRHNKTTLASFDMFENIKVGSNSKGCIEVVADKKYNRGNLFIGNYVTICDNVKFYLTPKCDVETLSTYRPNEDIYNFKNITIKDDVWLGENVCIKAGVTINQGAVIEAGCTITEDIPPYAIVKNNQISGYRFSDDIIKKLLKIDFSKNADLKTLSKTITSENINEIRL